MVLAASLDYSSEDLNWSVAGNTAGTNPNILSELKWVDQAGFGSSLVLRKWLLKGWFMEGSLAVKKIGDGYVSDTDFGSDYRQDITFYIKLNTRHGEVISGDLIAGRQIYLKEGWDIKMAAGYSLNHQYLYLITPDSDLESSYLTQWRGGVVYVGSNIEMLKNLSSMIGLSYYQLKYRATADWKLREDFQHPLSFSHQARGFGTKAEFQLMYHLSNGFSLAVRLNRIGMKTGKGLDRIYYTNGKIASTQLNEVQSRCLSFSLGFIKTF